MIVITNETDAAIIKQIDTRNLRNFDLIWIVMSLALFIVPAALLFTVVSIIDKRKCENCNSNFCLEKIKSKLIDQKEYIRNDRTKIRELQRNTYKCNFCNEEFIKNEQKEFDKT